MLRGLTAWEGAEASGTVDRVAVLGVRASLACLVDLVALVVGKQAFSDLLFAAHRVGRSLAISSRVLAQAISM